MIDDILSREFNSNAELLPVEPNKPDSVPAIRVAGALVYVYVHPLYGLTVSVDVDEAEADLTRADGTVPMRVQVGVATVFADPPHDSDR
ncbi:hypothetical protein [Streptomyces sp. NPDC059787]|uniref:hypothetical protein n=1 Tax=Streptomyces sp. NPDC059787 TaxID=3346947 RepID=UPI003647F4F9